MKHIERIFHKDSRAIGPEWSQQQETIDCCSFQYFQPCQVTRDAKQHCQSYLAKNTLFSICGIVQLGSLNVFSCSEYFKVVVNLGLGIWCHKGLPSSSMGLLSSLSNMGSHNHTHEGQTLASLSTGPPSTIADDNDSAPGIDDEVERKGDSSFLPIKVTFLQQFYQQNVGY